MSLSFPICKMGVMIIAIPQGLDRDETVSQSAVDAE